MSEIQLSTASPAISQLLKARKAAKHSRRLAVREQRRQAKRHAGATFRELESRFETIAPHRLSCLTRSHSGSTEPLRPGMRKRHDVDHRHPGHVDRAAQFQPASSRQRLGRSQEARRDCRADGHAVEGGARSVSNHADTGQRTIDLQSDLRRHGSPPAPARLATAGPWTWVATRPSTLPLRPGGLARRSAAYDSASGFNSTCCIRATGPKTLI